MSLTTKVFVIFALISAAGVAQPSRPVSVEFEPDLDPDRADEERAHNNAARHNAYTLRVAYVKVEGRWARQVLLPLAVGELLTREKVSAAMQALRASINNNTIYGYGLRSEGEVGVLYIAVKFDTNTPPAVVREGEPPAATVGVIFQPYFVHLSLVKMGDNVLPIPRSARPTFYESVPKPLLALKPMAGLSYDRAFGAALSLSLNSDLLHLTSPARITNAIENSHLEVSAHGTEALSEVFYRADIGLKYSIRRAGRLAEVISLWTEYDAVREPLGDGEEQRRAGVAGLGATLKLMPNTRLSLDTVYARSDDDLSDGASSLNTERAANEQLNRVLIDAIPRPIFGFLRGAAWEDNGWLIGPGGSYQRLVGRLAYSKEIPLVPNQTVGLEIIAGAGRAWGDTPEHARFFGGNSPEQFLYDSPATPGMIAMPSGPLIRSFGQSEAGLRDQSGRLIGGDAFWHVNLNLTIPIRPWSFPLIPDEETDLPDAEGNPTRLKKLLKNQIDVTGPSMLAAALKKEGLTEAEANARARAILDEVRPATHYVIDDANLYSVKPLLMFDAAGISGGRGTSAETWLAAGGGVQLTIVTARFELGYMHTLFGPTFGDRGNFFVRLAFQNLF